ncbi:hypothetical protein DSM3645_04033 [Blastopirellula marina DSM 3645]|uniref:Uncharacterized protein n=1 Tax=Blastopirellula marina DSM 3645 TaxID=314230 RepID=A3ZV50_9BACT|nr:hypothetical protein DSM3645_04033 [Blastopirellula marina DSM 3645]
MARLAVWRMGGRASGNAPRQKRRTVLYLVP